MDELGFHPMEGVVEGMDANLDGTAGRESAPSRRNRREKRGSEKFFGMGNPQELDWLVRKQNWVVKSHHRDAEMARRKGIGGSPWYTLGSKGQKGTDNETAQNFWLYISFGWHIFHHVGLEIKFAIHDSHLASLSEPVCSVSSRSLWWSFSIIRVGDVHSMIHTLSCITNWYFLVGLFVVAFCWPFSL